MSAMGGPDIDTEAVGQKVGKKCEGLAKAVMAEMKKIKKGIKEEETKKAGSTYQYKVEAKEFQFTKASPPVDIKKAALLQVSGDQFRTEVKSSVWGEMEPDISSKITLEGTLREKAVNAAQSAVNKVCDKAMDAAVKKLNEKYEKRAAAKAAGKGGAEKKEAKDGEKKEEGDKKEEDKDEDEDDGDDDDAGGDAGGDAAGGDAAPADASGDGGDS